MIQMQVESSQNVTETEEIRFERSWSEGNEIRS